MVYRVIDAGMVSMPDVLDGRVSLADIVEASHYLDMKSDIEWANTKIAWKEGGKHGRSSA